MIVLDASVLIAHVEPADVHHDAAKTMLRAAVEDRLAISPITLAEFYVGPARAGVIGRAERVVAALDLEVVPLDGDAPTRLAALRAETGLKLPDCCVLLAAERVAGAVASFDERVRRQAASIGLPVVT